MSMFCPDCGSENSDEAELCQSCGGALATGDDDPASRARPTRWSVLGTSAGLSVFLLSLVYLVGFAVVPAAQEVTLYIPDEGRLAPAIAYVSPGGLLVLLGPLACFFVAGFLPAVAFRGRYLREIALGGLAGVLAQCVAWAISLGGGLSAFFSANLHLLGDDSQLAAKAFLLMPFMLLVFLFCTVGTAMMAWVLIEVATKRTMCLCCGERISTKPPRPKRCPKCSAPQATEGVQWPSVFLATLVTAAAFTLVLAYLAEPLGFFFHCDPYEMTDACREARSQARESSSWSFFTDARDRDDAHLVLFHKWKYLGYMTILMVFAPFLLAWLGHRSSRLSAGLVIIFNWAACTMMAIVVVAQSGGFEGAYVWFVRFHLIALVVWGIVGFVAAMAGSKLHYRSGGAFLKDIE